MTGICGNKANPAFPTRKALRLKNYDYSSPGAYFATICSHERQSIFGEIRNGVMGLNELGSLIWEIWDTLDARFPAMERDEFVVMPNHVHAVIVVPGTPREAGAAKLALGTIVCALKSVATREVNRLRGTPGGVLWQGRYHDHIIRDEQELFRICKYIAENPLKWQIDRENPDRQATAPVELWEEDSGE
jgi:REP element-mobilizing transposase RayT